LSLQSAIQIDRNAKVKTANSRRSISKYNPIYSFKPTLFRQPSLTEERVELPSLSCNGSSPPCTLENSSYDTMESNSASHDGEFAGTELSNRWSHSIELSPVHEMGSLSPLSNATSRQLQSGPLRSPTVSSMNYSNSSQQRPWSCNEDTVSYRRPSYFSPTAANMASREYDRRDFSSTAIPLPEHVTTRKNTPRQHHGHVPEEEGSLLIGESGRPTSLVDQTRRNRPYVYELDEAAPMLTSFGSEQVFYCVKFPFIVWTLE
jgi:hypothetical protein